MTPTEWAGFGAGVIAVLSGVLIGLRFLVKGWLNELRPNGGASMKDQLFDQLPEDQKFEELTLENLEMVKNSLDPDENSAIIFDDQGAYLKNNETKKLLKELIMNRRHLHLSIFFLVQTYLSIERDVRKLFSNCFIFRCSKKEMETIADELIEQKKEHLNEIIKIVYNKPYQYLFINTDSQRLFSGFDELLINDDD